MPSIQIEARLVKITSQLARGDFMLLYPDDTYQVLDADAARSLSSGGTAKPTPTPAHRRNGAPKEKYYVTLEGKRVTIEPKLFSVLQYMAKHGPMTSRDMDGLGGGGTLSRLKSLGFVSASLNSDGATYIYSPTDTGRALASATPPA